MSRRIPPRVASWRRSRRPPTRRCGSTRRRWPTAPRPRQPARAEDDVEELRAGRDADRLCRRPSGPPFRARPRQRFVQPRSPGDRRRRGRRGGSQLARPPGEPRHRRPGVVRRRAQVAGLRGVALGSELRLRAAAGGDQRRAGLRRPSRASNSRSALHQGAVGGLAAHQHRNAAPASARPQVNRGDPARMTPAQAVTADNAWRLVEEYTESPVLRRHMLSVAAAMKTYARKHGEDETRWEVAGILHDFDFERFPHASPHSSRRLLLEMGWPADLVEDIYSHGDVGLARDTPIRKALYAVDELCGFIIACALVKPDRSLSAVEPATVRKKMKDKAFARAVHRDELFKGAEVLGIPFDEHVVTVRDALIPIADRLGLNP